MWLERKNNVRSNPRFAFACLLLATSAGRGQTSLGKETTSLNVPQMLGAICFDASVDWAGNQVAYLCQQRNGGIAAWVGQPTSGLVPISIPAGVAKYSDHGIFERNYQRLRGKSYFVSSTTRSSLGYASSQEIFSVDTTTGAVRSLVRVGDSLLGGTISTLYGPGVSPDGRLMAFLAKTSTSEGLFVRTDNGKVSQMYKKAAEVVSLGYNGIILNDGTIYFTAIYGGLNPPAAVLRVDGLTNQVSEIVRSPGLLFGEQVTYFFLREGAGDPILGYSVTSGSSANFRFAALTPNGPVQRLSPASYTGIAFPFAVISFSAATTYAAFSSYSPPDNMAYQSLNICEPTCFQYAHFDGANPSYGFYAAAFNNGVFTFLQSPDGVLPDGYPRLGVVGAQFISWPIIAGVKQSGANEGGQAKVSLSGFNLNPNNAQVEFTWGGLAPVLVNPESSSSETQAIAFVPAKAVGDVSVRVIGQGTTGPLYSAAQKLHIIGPPSAKITATTTVVPVGGTSNISWTVIGDVTQVTINGQSVPSSGTWADVVITDSKIFQLIANGPAGTSTDSVTIVVPATIQNLQGGNDQNQLTAGQHVAATGVGFIAQSVVNVLDLDGNLISTLPAKFVSGNQIEFDLPGDLPAPQWFAFIPSGGTGSLVGEPYYAEVIAVPVQSSGRARQPKRK